MEPLKKSNCCCDGNCKCNGDTNNCANGNIITSGMVGEISAEEQTYETYIGSE